MGANAFSTVIEYLWSFVWAVSAQHLQGEFIHSHPKVLWDPAPAFVPAVLRIMLRSGCFAASWYQEGTDLRALSPWP